MSITLTVMKNNNEAAVFEVTIAALWIKEIIQHSYSVVYYKQDANIKFY